MGTEKDKGRAAGSGPGPSPGRTKPPPIPPRPQHLTSAKTMAKYSSMPDVLNGWRRDTNPDLLKLSHNDNISNGSHSRCATLSTKISALDMATGCSLRQNGVIRVVNGSVPLQQRQQQLQQQQYQLMHEAKMACNYRASLKRDDRPPLCPNERADSGGRRVSSSKKFSCIPSRSNSKKKKNVAGASVSVSAASAGGGSHAGSNGNCAVANGAAKNRSEISQTSWYVENVVDNTVVQLSKCEITLNCDDTDDNATNCRYPAVINRTTSSSPSSSASTLTSKSVSSSSESSARTKTSFFRKLRPCINGNSGSRSSSSNSDNCGENDDRKAATIAPMAASSSSINGLPPLPKSLSDASLLWDPSDAKKLSSVSVNLSPSSSSASSSSRSAASGSGGSGAYAKVPLQPSSSSSSSRSGSVVFDSAASSGKSSAALLLIGDGTQRDEKRSTPPTPPPPPPRKPTSLDIKLATLRKEMYDLRQMDLALLSQLWSLNEAITEFRHMQVSLSPNSPSLHSSDEEDSGCYYSNVSSQGMVTSNHHSNTLGSNSSRSSISTNRSTLRETVKPQ